MNASVEQQLRRYKGRIIWLASYPKSGNTWFRIFLTALMQDGVIDINNIQTEGYFSDRRFFDEYTGIDSTLLTPEEVASYLPDVVDHLARSTDVDRVKFVKIHDQYVAGEHEFINDKNTHAILYFIRNPLSVASSFASFMGWSIDETITFMNDENASLTTQEGINQYPYFEQKLGTWSDHVSSWINAPNVPLIVIRYEDLALSPFETFAKTLANIGLDIKMELIERAVKVCEFKNIKILEKKYGFKAKPLATSLFFRKGTIDGWKQELTQQQIEHLKYHHAPMMTKNGYM